MKNLLALSITVVFVALGLPARSQTSNTIVFQNDIMSLISNALTGMPVKTNELIRVQLYVGPDGISDENALVSVGASAPLGITPGRYNGGLRAIVGAAPGSMVTIQVRAFESTYGNTYEQAEAAPAGSNGRRALVGKSRLARVIPGGGPTNGGSRAVGPFIVTVAGGGPLITVSDTVVAEGSNGLYQATFAVRLHQAQSDPISVDYTTVDSTALAGQDYQPANGTLTFLPGETEKVVPIIITADAAPEPDESFHLELSNPTGGGNIVRPRGTCLITEVRIAGLSVDVSVTFNTVSNHFYIVERLRGESGWEPVPGATNIAGNGGLFTILDRGAGCDPMTLYRARLIE